MADKLKIAVVIVLIFAGDLLLALIDNPFASCVVYSLSLLVLLVVWLER
jgi:hypothetical protein